MYRPSLIGLIVHTRALGGEGGALSINDQRKMVPYGTKGSGLVGVATSESDETIGRSDRVVSHRIASHLIHLYHFTSKKQQDATDVLYFALVFGMASVTPKKRNASPDPFYKKQQLLSSLER